MAQLYPFETNLPIPNEPYLRYEYVGNARSITFARNVFPDGLLSSEAFLDLFADDPKNRNNVTGGTMFRAESFRGAGALENGTGVRWQSGYLMLAGTATMGDVWYIDDPCVVATVELESASYRGTQHDHMCDCLRSIDAAFMNALGATEGVRARQLAFIRLKMMHGVFQTYLANKISFRLGGFRTSPLKGIERIFEEEITGPEFRAALGTYHVPLSWLNRMAIVLSALPGTILRFLDRVMRRFLQAPPNWWKFLIRFPSHAASTITSAGASIKSDVLHA
jgi:hypothetical protein